MYGWIEKSQKEVTVASVVRISTHDVHDSTLSCIAMHGDVNIDIRKKSKAENVCTKH